MKLLKFTLLLVLFSFSFLSALDYSAMKIVNSSTDQIGGTQTADTWFTVIGFSEMLSSGASYSSNTITTQNDASTRKYLVRYDLSFTGTAGLWEIGISIDGANPTELVQRRISSSSDVGNIAGVAFEEIAPNKTIELWAKCDVVSSEFVAKFSHVAVVEAGTSSTASYASMYINNNSTAQSGISSFTRITGFTQGELSDWTFASNALTAGADAAGTYLAIGSVSFDGSQNTDYLLGLGLEGNDPYGEAGSSDIAAQRRIGTNNDIGNASFAGIITIAQNDVIDLQAQASNNITAHYATITLVKINGTAPTGYADMDITNNSTSFTIGTGHTKNTQFSNHLSNASLWEFDNSAFTPISVAAGKYLVNYYASVAVPTGSSLSFDCEIALFKNATKVNELTTQRALERKSSGSTDIGAISGVGIIEVSSYNDSIELHFDNISSSNSVDVTISYASVSLIRLEVIGDGSLPVELASFDAIQTSTNLAQLNWSTHSETDLAGYNVYRNTANNSVSAVKLNNNVIAGTNTSTTQNYSYTDTFAELDTEYFYWLESVDLDGATSFFGPVTITLTKGGEGEEVPDIVQVYGIKSIYPNPFNPTAQISYSLPKDSEVVIEIYNLKGEKVQTLNQGKKLAGMDYTATWTGKDFDGNSAASGVYLFKLKAGNLEQTQKAILLK